jgi:hypothetical protein
MNRIVPLVLRAVLVLLGIVLVLGVIADASGLRMEKVLAPIYNVDIRADNSSPPRYFADAVIGWRSHGDFEVSRAGDTIQVEIFNMRWTWHWQYYGLYVEAEVEQSVPLGANFVPGVNYTVVVNNVTEDFVAQT